jgi:energy-coupling factor transport system ATP-binding protein
MGLGHLRHAGLATLSGGELQKVALAAVLAMQPELLLLDEPTSQLDPVGSEDLLAAVRRLAEDTGSTVVLAEHRTERCLSMATRVLYMAAGTIVVDSDPHQFTAWAAEHHPELLPPVARLFAARRGGVAQPHGEQVLPMTVKDARRQLSGMPEGAVGPSAAFCAPIASGRDHEKPVIEVRGLTAGYPPEDAILEDLDLKLWSGDAIALMGANGAGKSTLVRHFNGMGRPLAGEVRLSGRDVGRLSIAEAARLCAYLGQDPGAYFVRDTVSEELDYSFDALGVAADARDVRRGEIVAELDLDRLLDRDPRDLSGGERTRVALAIVTCGDPLVVVLDEPTRGMDPAHKSDLSALLRRWAARGRCVVLVTHDVEFAARTVSRVVLLGDGGVLADDPVREALHGSLFFSTQVNRLLRHEVQGAIVEDDVSWMTAP